MSFGSVTLDQLGPEARKRAEQLLREQQQRATAPSPFARNAPQSPEKAPEGSAPAPAVDRGAEARLAPPRPFRVEVGDPPFAVREGDTLRLTLPIAPRTKKNSSRGSGKVSAAAARFAYHVAQLIAPHKTALGLPLPELRYNCAAMFYTDNDASDTVGLMQGLADALEGAGVVTNDRQLWTWDGTDQVLAKLKPRVELVITPRGAMP